MPEPGEIRMLKPVDELHTCPACGYALGFHTSFVNANANHDNPIKSTRETWRVILICPECGARFDVGWRIAFAEFESKFMKAPVNPANHVVTLTAATKPPATPDAVAFLPPAHDDDGTTPPL